MQTVVLDTNVFLHSPNALSSFKGYEVVIPLCVIEELDNHKKRQDDAGRNARKTIKTIDQLKDATLPNGTPVRIIVDAPSDDEILSKGLDPDKTDNKIISIALKLRASGKDVLLISNDATCRVKARLFDVPAESFEKDRIHVDINDVYSGFAEIRLPGSDIDRLYAEKRIPCNEELYENEFVLVKDICNSKHTALARYSKGELVTLRHINERPWGIAPRNMEQTFFLEALMDPEIQLVTAMGIAGTGKTLLAVAASGHQTVELGAYNKVIYFKTIIPVGRDLGYLPGEEKDKLRPWMASAYDAYEYILGSEEALEDLIDRKLIQLSSLTYIRGRSLPRLFLVVDEASNMSPNEIKTIISRAGEGTKIVLIGDPYQIDHPFLDSQNNGLVYTIERFKGQKIFAHITLNKPERSTLSGLAAELL